MRKRRSNLALPLSQSLKPTLSLNRNGVVLRRGWRSMIASDWRDKGSSCWRPFLVRAAGNQLSSKVNLAPSQLADLIATLSSEQEQSDDVSETTIAKLTQELCDLSLGQHSLPAVAFVGLSCALHRIKLDQAFGNSPGKEARARSERGCA